MPVPKGTRYRVKRSGGKKIRLAFAPSGKVVEAKVLPRKKAPKKARSRKRGRK